MANRECRRLLGAGFPWRHSWNRCIFCRTATGGSVMVLEDLFHPSSARCASRFPSSPSCMWGRGSRLRRGERDAESETRRASLSCAWTLTGVACGGAGPPPGCSLARPAVGPHISPPLALLPPEKTGSCSLWEPFVGGGDFPL